MKKIRKLAAVLLVFALFIQVFPFTSWATESSASSPETAYTETGDPPSIVEEVVAKRESNTKHYLMSDGTYEAVSYAYPIHFYQDHQWVDINNSLTQVNDADGSSKIENKEANLKVSFEPQVAAQDMVTVQNEEYILGMGIESDTDSRAKIVESEASDSDLALPNLTSTLQYDQVFAKTDLQYITTPTGVKENIILEGKPSNNVYQFNLNTNGLKAKQNADNSISLYDAAKSLNDPVFTLSAPFMVDAAGEQSSAITVELLQDADGYSLKLTADADWLNAAERQYPVIIDPTIETSTDASSIDCQQVESANPDLHQNAMPRLTIGNGHRIYLKFTTPNLPTNSIVTQAQLQLYQDLYDDHFGGAITVYKTPTEWTATEKTWNNQPDFMKPDLAPLEMVDSQQAQVWSGFYPGYWNITTLAQEWCSTGKNNGMVLAFTDENVDSTIDFYSPTFDPETSGHISEVDAVPSIMVWYAMPHLNANGGYEYPVQPGSDKWTNFINHNSMASVCQIPKSILTIMSTDKLLEAVLKYPLLGDIFAFNSDQEGFDVVTSRFNGLQEFFE